MIDVSGEQPPLFEGFEAVLAAPAEATAPPVRSKPKYTVGKLYSIECSDIGTLTDQPRKLFGDAGISALAESVKKLGVVEPIVCSVDDKDHLTLMAGERRLRGAMLAGLKSIPVRILSGDSIEISIVENLMREDLTVIEEAVALATLKERRGYKLADLSNLTGKSEPTLCEILSVAKLPVEILDRCRTGSALPRDVLVLIARLKSKEEMIAAYDKYENGTMSRQSLKGASKRFRHSQATPATKLVSKFWSSLDKIDPTSLNELDREAFKSELEKLQEAIAKTLEGL